MSLAVFTAAYSMSGKKPKAATGWLIAAHIGFARGHYADMLNFSYLCTATVRRAAAKS